jgi:hypothetical protein
MFFAWLLLNDRSNTRNILRRRKKFLEDYSYVICQGNMEERLEHLFFDCPCAAAQWFFLGIVWNDEVQVHHKIITAKNAFPFLFFMEVFMVAAWCIWNERNAAIFNGKVPSVFLGKAVSNKRLNSICTGLSPIFTLPSGCGWIVCNFLSCRLFPSFSLLLVG